jgi:hypothetical protein
VGTIDTSDHDATLQDFFLYDDEAIYDATDELQDAVDATTAPGLMTRGLPPRSNDCIGTCLIESVWIVDYNPRVQVFLWEFAEIVTR